MKGPKLRTEFGTVLRLDEEEERKMARDSDNLKPKADSLEEAREKLAQQRSKQSSTNKKEEKFEPLEVPWEGDETSIVIVGSRPAK
jgi:hypothetical protein